MKETQHWKCSFATKVCLIEGRLKTKSHTIFLPLLSISGITVVEIRSWRSFTVHAEFMEVQLITFQASHSKSHLTQVSRVMRLSAPCWQPLTLRSYLQSWPCNFVVQLDHMTEKHSVTCVLPKRNSELILATALLLAFAWRASRLKKKKKALILGLLSPWLHSDDVVRANLSDLTKATIFKS